MKLNITEKKIAIIKKEDVASCILNAVESEDGFGDARISEMDRDLSGLGGDLHSVEGLEFLQDGFDEDDIDNSTKELNSFIEQLIGFDYFVIQ